MRSYPRSLTHRIENEHEWNNAPFILRIICSKYGDNFKDKIEDLYFNRMVKVFMDHIKNDLSNRYISNKYIFINTMLSACQGKIIQGKSENLETWQAELINEIDTLFDDLDKIVFWGDQIWIITKDESIEKEYEYIKHICDFYRRKNMQPVNELIFYINDISFDQIPTYAIIYQR